MGEISAIEWTDSTWNPWHGCIKVSPGCKNCYMYRDKKRYGQDPKKVVRSKPGTFNAPLKWKEPRMVFTCSWSDFFIEEADDWRDDAWDIIRRTPQHTYQILTKRPERITASLPKDWPCGFEHVWLGVSCENQEEADKRVHYLKPIDASVKFLSLEPLLAPIVLAWANNTCYHENALIEPDTGALGCNECENEREIFVDWVIVGGESGPDYRQIDAQWARDIRDDCKADGVAFFMKQMSGIKSKMQPIPEDLKIQQMPIKTGEAALNVTCV